MIARYRKALAALLGGLTPAAADAVLAAFGVHVNGPLAAAVCAGLAALTTASVKPNAPKSPLVPVPAGTTTTGGTAS